MSKQIRLGQVARKLNVGRNTIIEFLQNKGYDIDSNPNTKIDEKIISNGTVGPITKEIQTNYENAVLGTDNNSRNWLTYIE